MKAIFILSVFLLFTANSPGSGISGFESGHSIFSEDLKAAGPCVGGAYRMNEMMIRDIMASDLVSRQDPTGDLMALVGDAAQWIRVKGELAFDDFRVSGSRWRQD